MKSKLEMPFLLLHLLLLVFIVFELILCTSLIYSGSGIKIGSQAYVVGENVIIIIDNFDEKSLVIEANNKYYTLVNLTDRTLYFNPPAPGRYIVRIVDKEGNIVDRVEFTVTLPVVTTDKRTYLLGENVLITSDYDSGINARLMLETPSGVIQILQSPGKATFTPITPGKYHLMLVKDNTIITKEYFVVEKNLPLISLVDQKQKTVDAEVMMFPSSQNKNSVTSISSLRLKITPKNKIIKELNINGLRPGSNAKKELRIADVIRSDFVQSYAIDPSGLEFDSASITIKAHGTSLYKCKDWLFEEERCTGEWVLLRSDLVPGEFYTLEITRDDPAFGEKGRIWNVQNGTSIIPDGSTNISVSISQVNSSRAFVLFGQRMNSADDLPNRAAVYAKLNSTHVSFFRYANLGTVTIHWYVIEGSDIYVQSGNISYANSHRQRDVVLSPINKSNSIVITSASCDSATDADFHETFWTGEMISDTVLRLERGTNTNCDGQIGYFVVEFNDGSGLQTGNATLGATDTSTTITIGMVNKSSSWLYFTKRADDNAIQMTHTAVYGEITNNTKLTFKRRSATGVMSLKWFVVNISGAYVQHNYHYVSSTTTLIQNVTISNVNLTRSFPFITWDSSGAVTTYGMYYWTARLTNSTNLRFEKNLAGQTHNISWQVVQLNAPMLSIFWNNASLDLGSGLPSAGNLSSSESFTSYGDNFNVTIACSGNCLNIIHNWTNGTNTTGGGIAVVNFTCLNTSVGVFNAVFSLRSNNDTTDSNLSVTCEMLPQVFVAWNQSYLDIGVGNQSLGNITGSAVVLSNGVNTGVTLTCSEGNCSLIGHNWTNGIGMGDGEEIIVEFECSDLYRGVLNAVFNITSNEDTTPAQIEVSCQIEDITPPSSVNGLGETRVSYNWILWNWTNPSDEDFSHVEVWLNGTFYANTSLSYINVTGLAHATLYQVEARTVDLYGNVNATGQKDSAVTLTDSVPSVVLIAPLNSSRAPEQFRVLNATVYDSDTFSVCFSVFGSNVSPSSQDLLYRNCSFSNNTFMNYNWTSPLLSPDTSTEVVWHFDNRWEYGENATFVYNFASSIQNHSRSCTTTCPVFLENLGKFAGAFNYSGTSQYWLLDESYFTNAFSAKTLQLWIKPSTTAGVRTIYEEGSSTAGMALRINAGVLQFATRNSGAASQVTIARPYTDTSNWHFISVSFNNSNLSMYIDGVLVNTTTASYSSIAAHANSGGLGATYSTDAFGTTATGNYYAGLIDEVRILNYAPSPEQVYYATKLKYNKTYYWFVNASDANTMASSSTWHFNISNGSVHWNQSALFLGINDIKNGNMSANATIISIGPNNNVSISCESGSCGIIVASWNNATNMSDLETRQVNFTCINSSKGSFSAIYNLTSLQDREPEQIIVSCEFLTDINVVWNQSVLDIGTTTQFQGSITGYADIISTGVNNYTNVSCVSGNCSIISQNWTNGTDIADQEAKQVQFVCSDSLAGSMSAVFSVVSNNDTTPNSITVACFVIDPPPGSVIGLGETSKGYDWILWNWTNPPDADFSHTEVWINGTFYANITTQHYNATGLYPGKDYEIETRTVDTAGNINLTWVNDTAVTEFNAKPNISLISPLNYSRGLELFRILNATVSNTEPENLCVMLFGSTSASPSFSELLYKNCTFVNNSYIPYLWNAPLLLPDGNTEVVWHFDNRSEYGENNAYVHNFASSIENHSRFCSLNCPLFLEGQGKFAGAFNYSGNGQFWLLNESYFNNLFFARTVQLWIKPSTTAGSRTIYEEGSSTSGMALRINSGMLEFATRNTGAASQVTISRPYTDTSNWHFISVSFDNGNLSMYIDGVLENTTMASYGSISAHSDEGAIGATNGTNSFGGTAGNYYAGLIDEVRILNYAPSPENVMTAAKFKYGQTYYWYGNAYDPYQYSSSDTWQFTIADNISPLVFINISLNNSVTNSSRPSIGFNFSENYFSEATCTLYIDSLPYNTTSGIHNWTLAYLVPATPIIDGNHSVSINCTDAEDNEGKSEIIYITVDTHAPKIINLSPVGGALFFRNSVVNITANVTDNTSISLVWVNVSWDSGSILGIMEDGDGDGIYNYSFSDTSQSGRYNISFFANDTTGNLNNTEWTWFNISPPSEIIINLSAPNADSGDSDGFIDFVFNITSTYNITECRLIINGSVKMLNTSVDKTLEQHFMASSFSAQRYYWSINCTDLLGWSNESETRYFSVIFATNYSGRTTDFSQVNLSNIGNLIIEKPGFGMLNFSETVNLSSGADLDNYLLFGDGFVSLDSLALPMLNKSALITIEGLSFMNTPVVMRDNEICIEPLCSIVSYDAGTLKFSVLGFTNYSASANSRLQIYDENDLGMERSIYESVLFFANYTNRTSGEEIENAMCNISFEDYTGDMSFVDSMYYNSSVSLYTYMRVITEPGSYNWSVECVADGFEPLTLTDETTIYTGEGYEKHGFCTGEYIQTSSTHRQGYLGRGEVINLYCQLPKKVAEDEYITVTIIPSKGYPVTKKIYTPKVMRSEYEVIYS
ncbi:MAG: LamG domain-containing protein [Candidatus Woesearchaeota archaeon]